MQSCKTALMTTVTPDPRWQAIVSRDKAADGRFVYGVQTTGIYCSPSCPSRRPRPENVRFFADAAEAERVGFRPCKRCRQGRPSLAQEQATKIAAACRYIEQQDDIPRLAQMAAHAGVSPYYFHRLFKSITGLTPKAYASACRGRRVRQRLDQSDSVTGAIMSAGYQSAGNFYQQADALLGMTPGDYRAGKERISFSRWDSALWGRFWWRKASGASAPFRWGTMPNPWCGNWRINIPTPGWRATMANSPGGWHWLSALSMRPASGWIYPWISRAPRFSRGSGRLCRTFPPAAR